MSKPFGQSRGKAGVCASCERFCRSNSHAFEIVEGAASRNICIPFTNKKAHSRWRLENAAMQGADVSHATRCFCNAWRQRSDEPHERGANRIGSDSLCPLGRSTLRFHEAGDAFVGFVGRRLCFVLLCCSERTLGCFTTSTRDFRRGARRTPSPAFCWTPVMYRSRAAAGSMFTTQGFVKSLTERLVG